MTLDLRGPGRRAVGPGALHRRHLLHRAPRAACAAASTRSSATTTSAWPRSRSSPTSAASTATRCSRTDVGELPDQTAIGAVRAGRSRPRAVGRLLLAGARPRRNWIATAASPAIGSRRNSPPRAPWRARGAATAAAHHRALSLRAPRAFAARARLLARPAGRGWLATHRSVGPPGQRGALPRTIRTGSASRSTVTARARSGTTTGTRSGWRRSRSTSSRSRRSCPATRAASGRCPAGLDRARPPERRRPRRLRALLGGRARLRRDYPGLSRSALRLSGRIPPPHRPEHLERAGRATATCRGRGAVESSRCSPRALSKLSWSTPRTTGWRVSPE